MNGRLAKTLRRAARQLTVGNHERLYIHKNRRSTTICLEPTCTRAVYKSLKMLQKGKLHV